MARILAVVLILGSAAALRAPQRAAAYGRRAVLGAFFAAPVAAARADVEGGALGATCMGFGCNPYQGTDFNGLPAAAAPDGAMPYPDFLAALKDKKVEGVVFQPPMGDVAFAIIDGKSVRIGEGWPVEVSNSWSSPTWVVRILQNEGVPYAWNFDLKAKNSYKTRVAAGQQRYDPRAGLNPGEGQKAWFEVPDVGKAPKMYGDGTF